MAENILARVPGQYLGAALQTLPNPETAKAETMEVTIEVPGIGTVRVTAERMKHKRARSTYYFWSPKAAVLLV